jgi:uncharacterized protein (DUF58 family)
LVDWRAYARLDRLYLKQYREERARTVSVLLDTSASLDWGDGDQHKGVYARRLGAALAWIALGKLERIHIYALRDDSAQRLPAPLNRYALPSLFTALNDIRESGSLALHRSVADALPQLRGHGPIFLISDLLDTDWHDTVSMIAGRDQGGVILQVLGADEWDPPLGDEVELQDSESGELRQTRFGPAECNDYRQRLHMFVNDISQTCRRLGLTHVALNSADPIADTLLKRLPAAGVLV